MRILALDSCSRAGGAAVLRDGQILGSVMLDCGFTHSETLLVSVNDLLSSLRMKLRDMDAIAVTVGPGSFTGIRIGLATAKGLAMAAGLPLLPVSSLLALAYNIACFDGVIAACMDARRGQVYNALFARKQNMHRLCPDRAVSAAALADELTRRGAPVIFVGDGATLCYNECKDRLPCAPAPECQLQLQPAMVGAAAEHAYAAGEIALTGHQEIMPVYLRLPQAERERLERERKKEHETDHRE